MPPRIHLHPQSIPVRITEHHPFHQQCLYASVATTPAFSPNKINAVHPIARHPPTQPPSHKPPELRKSQLLRQYTSLLRSTPLILLFQHNNLRAVEWMGIRRELLRALQKVDAQLASTGSASGGIAEEIRIQTVHTRLFKPAMRINEFYKPEKNAATIHPSDPRTASSAVVPITKSTSTDDDGYTHVLSRQAHKISSRKRLGHGLEAILTGPMAVVTFPAVTPQHLKAVLSILAPSSEFPAPKRKDNPSFHDPVVQAGLQKLIMLAARVEGKVFDQAGVRWVGGISGGIDGLRGQLVAMLQGIGATLTSTLESASKTVYLTMEGRKTMMEEEEKGGKEQLAQAKAEKKDEASAQA